MTTPLPDPGRAEEVDIASATTFQGLFETERDPMLRLARFLVGRHGPAEDLVHDAFLTVFSKFDTVQNHRTYLRTCVVNRCKAHHRREAMKIRRRQPAALQDGPTEYLMDALGALPMRQRTAVVLRYYLGATDNEIAEILGCEEKSVRSLTYRGTQTLRVVFAEDD